MTRLFGFVLALASIIGRLMLDIRLRPAIALLVAGVLLMFFGGIVDDMATYARTRKRR